MKAIELITQSINNGHGGLILSIFIVVAILIIASFIFILNALSKIPLKGSKFKFGKAEWSNGDKVEPENEQEDNTDTISPISNTKTIDNKFFSFIQTIVSESVLTGYEKCKIRADLFNNQMNSLIESFSYMESRILAKYTEVGGKNYEIARILLDHSIKTKIIEPIRKIFVLDRLAEKSLDDFIERQRSLTDGAYLSIYQDIERHMTGGSNNYDEPLLKAVESYKDDFKRTIVSSLESAHKNARNFLENIDNEDNLLNKHINNYIRSYLVNNNISLPTNWLDPERSTPPAADTIGEK